MHLTINLSPSAEARIRAALGPDLDGVARDALLIHAYRTGRISLGFLAEVLDLPIRLDAQRWLAEHNEPLNYDQEEWEADHETVRKQFGVAL